MQATVTQASGQEHTEPLALLWLVHTQLAMVHILTHRPGYG